MVDVTLRDRLQPSLLDRLTDDERLLTVVRVTPDTERMQRERVSPQDLDRAFEAQGLRRLEGGSAALLEYAPPPLGTKLAALRELPLQGAAAGGEARVVAGTVCRIEFGTRINLAPESAERRLLSMRRLREAVLRDLGWLLNAASIEEVVDLEPYPEVRQSVVNYGLRTQSGRALTSIDPQHAARRIRDAIVRFEPRLGNVRVTPEEVEDSAGAVTLSFLIEAELWGQPAAQQLSLRTRLDVDSGDVRVTERGTRD